MGKALLAGGVEIEVATKDEVSAISNAAADRVIGAYESSAKHPILRSIPQSVAFTGAAATGSWVLDFGSPGAGSIWYVAEVVVFVTDDRTAVNGSVASLYIGRAPGYRGNTADAAPFSDLRRPAIATPAVFTFAKDNVGVHDQENLYAMVYSPTTPVSVIGGVATVREYKSTAMTANWVR